MDDNIRKATFCDLERITEIYNWAVENTTASFDINPQTIEQRAEWFAEHNDRYPLIVYDVEDKVVGYASLSEFRSKEGYRNSCELSVYIDPEFHNQGIGNKLMERIIKLGGEVGFHVIISSICADNKISIKMHEKFGFEPCGYMKEVGFKFGRYLDSIFYQLFV